MIPIEGKDITTINSEKEKKLNKLLLLIKEEKELENKKLDKEKEILNEQNEKIESLKAKLLEIQEKRIQQKQQAEYELKELKNKNLNIESQINSVLSCSSDQSNNDHISEKIEYYSNKQKELQNKLNKLKESKDEEILKSKFLELSTNEKKLSDKV
ncbi:hypothetical protein DICPUDRAFT_78299 [Dictyostelium purpureum]|uniref:Uncharacterized protein n=1 Tax=Dictyostelium purpureum TaxID=5786 RepID=F0ZJ54_DICPU|nr:uncharacterized protein DICPUDRAFT_78299 [Dictyostelium purpureum]EGC36016.1 hypothetical protein DICPUDRAFT_78299 [Dictyostelium purpureum]|eukprot:XP_003287454.1 hypothetical protein DICPUDRAFT_78299 [Dictyostelium purpureum]